MKKAITAEQITEWFTIGTQFANIRITDDGQKDTKKTEEATKGDGRRLVHASIGRSGCRSSSSSSLLRKSFRTCLKTYTSSQGRMLLLASTSRNLGRCDSSPASWPAVSSPPSPRHRGQGLENGSESPPATRPSPPAGLRAFDTRCCFSSPIRNGKADTLTGRGGRNDWKHLVDGGRNRLIAADPVQTLRWFAKPGARGYLESTVAVCAGWIWAHRYSSCWRSEGGMSERRLGSSRISVRLGPPGALGTPCTRSLSPRGHFIHPNRGIVGLRGTGERGEGQGERGVLKLCSALEGLSSDPTKQQASPESDKSEGVLKTKQGKADLLGSTLAPQLADYEYPSLPITKHRQELISLIENNSVVIIRGATGSGKTTQLPQFILDYYREKDAPCNLVVTQPRKIGASSIARWVARERKCTLGSLVGYQVGLEKVATEHTRLIYMTTGVLLQKLVSAKSLTEYSHIFIDEVHERTEDLDFLLLVVRKLLHSNSRFVKVILMSATINCKEFAEYFSTPIRSRMNPAYVFEVEGAPYTVEEFYLDDLCRLLPCRVDPIHADDPCISVEMYNVAVSLIQSFDELEAKDQSTQTEKEGCSGLPERGSVLVFLPGLAEIHYMQDALAKLVRKRLQVYPLHSTVTLEEQNGVFLVPVPGYRKIILSTNIAESSVTVPDVKYVIDFCLARHLVCDKETNFQCLRLTWASKTNCNQRRGRAGRVSKGYCYRLVTKDFWKKEIPDFVVPEMLRSPLASTMLKVKLLDMGDPRSVLSTALSPPNIDDIGRTVLQLKELGALSVKQDEQGQSCYDGELTFLGRVLAHLPVDLHLGKMIVLGHVFGCLEECLIIAASLSLKSFFAMPSLQRLAGYRSKLAFAGGVPSDSIAFVNAFKAWYTSRSKGEFRHPKDELEWGKENCIQIKRIREVAELFEDLKKRVAQFNMHLSEKSPPTDYANVHKQRFILQIAIAGAFYPNYFSLGEIDEELASKDLSGNDPKTTVMVRNLPPYSFLYYKQLQSLFRQCGQVKAISFDGSRAYVEFFRTSAKHFGVLPEVSLALLLSHQRMPLSLSVHPTEEVEAKAGGRTVSPLRYARVNVDFQNHSVYPVGILSSTTDLEKLPPNPNFIVSITEVVEVGHFWGFLADEASLEKQRRMTAAINSRELRRVSVSLYPSLLCLAPFESEETGQYFRAKVLHVWGNSVEVFFVDYGNTTQVSCSSLRDLPADLATPPFQAQEFQVAGIRPSAQSMILGGQWSCGARNRFITLANGRSLIVSLFSILHGVMRVSLFISTDTLSTSVADIMVQEGHAQKAEESFESKQSHEVLLSLYKDLEEGTYMGNSTSSSWNTRKEEEKELIDSLLEAFSRTNQASLKCKVPVHGPASPHRATFHSMSNVSQYRSVVIDRDSINSVAVNDSPEDKHLRMLVAGFVSVSSSGSHILLKETTLLPMIHGLPSLLCMLFTPIMELRTNEERTCYSGALCGLGWNPLTQEAVLPEHDMELAFDVTFDVEDITEINALRGDINRLVCEGPNGPLHLGPERVSRLQESARDRLIRLFTKSPPREHITPCYYEKPKEWNQVEPSQKMELLQKDDLHSRGVLFQLHPVTLLAM
ncbi:ATP-dependent RNA helicase TDRD9 [Megalops cyprinoides]|uniref:ATP-dependent RNA helicase TDRD9 n=1 Tax=Megalops cyprinoides TaxID=118141 RepID=UPI0018649A13|nr:ATP-dependent RNA helicase TDRD9 [Megalops cyprinoides]